MKYQVLIYPQLESLDQFSPLSAGTQLVARSNTFNLLSENEVDRFEIWENEEGDLTDEAALLYYPAIKDEIARNIRGWYASLLNNIVSPYSPEERETWSIQTKETEAYVLDNTTPTPFIDALSANRNITKEVLITKIQENVTAFQVAAGTILGKQQAQLDILPTFTKFSEVLGMEYWL
jgi:hypothetical protein